MEQKQEKGRVRALFAWAEPGHDTAVRIAGLYRRAGMEIFLHGLAEEAGLMELGASRNMTHILYFLDGERLRLISLADEMGGFTADILVTDLLLPEG